MRIVIGRGRNRQVAELPCAQIMAQLPQEREAIAENIMQRTCRGTDLLARRGDFRIYDR